jgi:hypothetical protein
MKKKKEPIKPRIVYMCLTCPDQPEFVFRDGGIRKDEVERFKKHMLKVHKVRKDKLKGKMHLTLALDGSDFYNNTFEGTIGGVKPYPGVCCGHDEERAGPWL